MASPAGQWEPVLLDLIELDDAGALDGIRAVIAGQLERVRAGSATAAPGEDVRYVIEARPALDGAWKVMFSAPARDDQADAGVSEGYAREMHGTMSAGRDPALWQLVRRTTVVTDEHLGGGDPPPPDPDGDSGHDD